MKTRNALSSVLVLSCLYSSYVHAQELNVALGAGTRNISAAEKSVEEYLKNRGYAEQLTDLEESINLEGRAIPYVFLLGSYIPKKRLLPLGIIEHELELDVTSSLSGSKEDHDTLDVEYEGYDLGEVDGNWSYKINSYLSLSLGSRYIPFTLYKGKSRLQLGFIPKGGVSYINGFADLDISLARNVLYRSMDPEYVEEEFGLTEKTRIETKFYGLGYFFHPSASLAFQRDPLAFQFDWGYRLEAIPLHMTETIKSFRTTEEETKSTLDLSGNTFSLEVKWRF